ncbi:MAG TPA: sugar transferase, partial [Phenylobacterium sp.]|nr:sugar transferase [Phenylobacterium sp.]
MNVISLNMARAARLERQAEPEKAMESPVDVPAAEQQRSADRRGPLRPGRLVSARARISGYATARLFRITDVAAIFACALIARPWEAAGAGVAAMLLLGVTLVLLAGLNLARSYDFSRREGLAFHLARLAVAVSGAGGATLMGLFLTRSHPQLWEAVGVWLCLSLVALYALHTTWFLVVRHWRSQGRLTPNIVVLGATEGVGRMIASALDSRDVAVLGIFDDRAARAPAQIQGVPVLGDTQALLSHRVLPYVDRIVIGVPASAQTRVRQLIERLEMLPNEIALLLDGDSAKADAAYARIADLPLAHVAGVQADEARAFAKRMVDVVVGLAALVAAAPIMAAVALAVKLESPGPALFRQRRHG